MLRLIVLLLFVSSSAAAMEFRFQRLDMQTIQMGVVQQVFADGVITPETPRKFANFVRRNQIGRGATIYLNSEGGNLLASIKFGRQIRALRFDTAIGRHGGLEEVSPLFRGQAAKVESGSCYSACALAFLGGIHRSLSLGSLYGVHRFASVDGDIDAEVVQIVSAKMIDYINEMGVSQELFSIGARTANSTIRIIPETELWALNVLTKPVNAKWGIEMVEGEFILGGLVEDRRGFHQIYFSCNSGRIEFLSMISMIDLQTRKEATDAITGFGEAAMIADGDAVEVPQIAIEITDDGDILIEGVIDTALASQISAADSLGIGLFPPSRTFFMGFEAPFEDRPRTLFKDYYEGCTQSAIEAMLPVAKVDEIPIASRCGRLSVVEQHLCHDHRLRRLEETMRSLSEQAISARKLDARLQENWIRMREETCSLDPNPASCIEKMTERRIEFLSDVVQGVRWEIRPMRDGVLAVVGGKNGALGVICATGPKAIGMFENGGSLGGLSRLRIEVDDQTVLTTIVDIDVDHGGSEFVTGMSDEDLRWFRQGTRAVIYVDDVEIDTVTLNGSREAINEALSGCL